MAADLHQAHLLLSPAEAPPVPLFPTSSCSASTLTSPPHSTTITQQHQQEEEEEEEEQPTTESIRRMAQYMHHEEDNHDHLYFQSGHSEEFLSPKSLDWHQPCYNLSSVCPTMQSQRGHLHEVPHHILNSFQNMSLAAKRPTLAHHNSDHLDPLGRVPPTDNRNRALQLQINQAEKSRMRQSSSSTYQKPHRQAPNFQQQQRRSSSSGMRAVFLGSRMGSSGTGVFLPRTCVRNGTESHTKPRCSTVLIPARVAQALMVHFDKMEARSSLQGGFPPQHGGRSGQWFQQKSQAQKAAPAIYDHDSIGLRLPQEWMY